MIVKKKIQKNLSVKKLWLNQFFIIIIIIAALFQPLALV